MSRLGFLLVLRYSSEMRACALVLGLFVALLGPCVRGVEGAKLAAAINAKKEAQERAEKELQLTPEEVEKQRELAKEVEDDLKKLLRDNKDYIKQKSTRSSSSEPPPNPSADF